MNSIAPSISTATLQNENGNLTVSWELLHAGGINILTITVQCSIEGDGGLFNYATGGDMIIECFTYEECITGSVSIGPVTAETNYSCLVMAENNIEKDEISIIMLLHPCKGYITFIALSPRAAGPRASAINVGVIKSLFYTQHNTVTTVLIVLIKHFTTSVHCIKHQRELQCTGVLYPIYCTATPFEVENND